MSVNGRGMDRRRFLGSLAAFGGAAMFAGGAGAVLSGCASSGPDTAVGPVVGEPKRGGSLRLAMGGAASSDAVDVAVSGSVWSVGIGFQLYDRLLDLRPPADGRLGQEVVPAIAEEAEYLTADRVRIRLRDDVEFHNGKTVTADDVLFSYQRQVDPASPGNGAVMLETVDFGNSRVLDPRTVELVLNRPDAFFRNRLANNYLTIVPTDFDSANPVGTGPWKLRSFAPGRSVSFERFENYHGGPAFADEMTWSAFSEPAAQVNALTSGAVNLLANVQTTQIRLIEDRSDCQIFRTPTGSAFSLLAMAKKRSPFEDQRVREAFRLMIDRQAVVDYVYGGEATIANDLFNPYDLAFNSDIPQREHDPDRAKALLAAAGVSSLSLPLATGGFAPNFEVVVAQLARDAGIDIRVEKVDESSFYANHWMQDPLTATAVYTRPVADTVALTSLPTSPWNETQEDDPAVARLYDEAAATLDPVLQAELLGELQNVLWDRGGYVVPAYANQVDATAANVGGVVTDVSGQPFGGFRFNRMWLG